MKKPLYKAIIGAVIARSNCEKMGNHEWFERHSERIEKLVKDHMSGGSGIDSGTTIDLDKCKVNRLVFGSSYHMMNENGFYCGWVDFTVTVTGSLLNDFDLNIKGPFSRFKAADGLSDYLYDVFDIELRQMIEEWPSRPD